MSDFLNKTLTIESAECLENEMLNDCSSIMYIQQQQQLKDEIIPRTTDDSNETINFDNTSLLSCLFEIENCFNRFNSFDLFLLEEKPFKFEFEFE